ncbi:MADS-box transcription factor PHERES 1-like [Gossypium australe]|uniref:MADS-box transcription factor PHERES 1-like n=1 Tax=Gossypium australe TaxID=47621 RepID=A0A5B6VSS3_9ROSI|nr:MADS-box transcription factor PHERES 1-like [Gossypium australe]
MNPKAMRRKKVTLAGISNDNVRRANLKKRRLRPDESELMIWPSHDEVQQMLDEYRKTPKLDHLKKMVNKETYLKKRITKSKEQ